MGDGVKEGDKGQFLRNNIRGAQMLLSEVEPVLILFVVYCVSLQSCLILRNGFLFLNVRVVMSTSEAHRASMSWVFAGGLSNGDLSF